jgi:hypothetical protein
LIRINCLIRTSSKRPTLSPPLPNCQLQKPSAPTETFGHSDQTDCSDNTVESKQPEKFPQQKLLTQLLANGKPSQLPRAHRATLRGLSSAHYAPAFPVCQAVSEVIAAFFTPSSQCAKPRVFGRKSNNPGSLQGRDSRLLPTAAVGCRQPTGIEEFCENRAEIAAFWATQAGGRGALHIGPVTGRQRVALFRPSRAGPMTNGSIRRRAVSRGALSWSDQVRDPASPLVNRVLHFAVRSEHGEIAGGESFRQVVTRDFFLAARCSGDSCARTADHLRQSLRRELWREENLRAAQNCSESL